MLRETHGARWMFVMLIGCALVTSGCGFFFPWGIFPLPECTTNAHCDEGEVCEDGVCVEEVVPECETDADCAEGQVCEDGVCVEEVVPECETNADCAAGEVCEDGVCVEEVVPECETNADCAAGEVCEDGVCVEEAPGPDGTALFAANCALCHGDDGTGPPDVTGMTADDLSAGLESPAHGAITLTEEEIAAIAEFLGG